MCRDRQRVGGGAYRFVCCQAGVFAFSGLYYHAACMSAGGGGILKRQLDGHLPQLGKSCVLLYLQESLAIPA